MPQSISAVRPTNGLYLYFFSLTTMLALIIQYPISYLLY